MRKTLLISTLFLAAACAKNPDEIAAVEIGKNEYKGYSCKRLTQTKLEHTQALENASANQKKAATGDAVGVILLGLPISSMAGGDEETNIAVTKGHIQAIEREQERKSCK
ncbi:MAG: hypothetical protein N4A61_04755 [Pelagimonas sp.]|jgi:hypothetical protein|nr:hypothetical protein [Pelagimonas sp.]